MYWGEGSEIESEFKVDDGLILEPSSLSPVRDWARFPLLGPYLTSWEISGIDPVKAANKADIIKDPQAQMYPFVRLPNGPLNVPTAVPTPSRYVDRLHFYRVNARDSCRNYTCFSSPS